MTKKIAIVGAGITGLVVAKLLSKKKYNVNIYEKNSSIGGIMKDFVVPNNSFFMGPQFLDEKAKWLELFFNKQDIKKKFKSIDEDVNSYTKLFNVVEIKKNTNQPIIHHNINKINILKKNYNPNEFNSLYTRLNLYPNIISKELIRWCENFSDNLNILDESASKIYGKRLVYKNNSKKFLNFKKKNKIFNEIYAKSNKEKNKFLLPKNGYNDIFNHILKNLNKSNIELFTNSKLKLDNNNKLFNGDELINYDYLIWTANPIPLLKKFGENIDNKILKVQSFFFEIECKKNIICKYINVYSHETKIFRIYIYKKDTKMHMSIEAFFDRYNKKQEILYQAVKILNYFNIDIKIKIKNVYQKLEVRHIFLTKKDLNVFSNLRKKLPPYIIDGLWDKNLYRDQKLDEFPKYILNKIKSLNEK